MLAVGSRIRSAIEAQGRRWLAEAHATATAGTYAEVIDLLHDRLRDLLLKLHN